MGAHSTLYITRTRAIQEFMKHTYSPSDEMLEEFLDKLLDNRLYNTVIIPDDCEDNDDHML